MVVSFFRPRKVGLLARLKLPPPLLALGMSFLGGGRAKGDTLVPNCSVVHFYV